MRPLSELSLAELWELFPVVLAEPDPRWAQRYEQARADLAALWGPQAVRISHIGSTAVPGLLAKPTVDILLEVTDDVSPHQVLDRSAAAGWTHMPGAAVRPVRLSFNRGYTPAGFAEQVFHLHVREAGDWDELYFRDHLVAHPEVAREYERVKRTAADRFEHDRDAYTEAKSDFVRSVTARARAETGGRHVPPVADGRPGTTDDGTTA